MLTGQLDVASESSFTDSLSFDSCDVVGTAVRKVDFYFLGQVWSIEFDTARDCSAMCEPYASEIRELWGTCQAKIVGEPTTSDSS